MIKAFLFDLDGVLVDSKLCHYNALNRALAEIDSGFCISEQEQADTYEGLTTRDKLEILHSSKGLPRECFDTVWEAKRTYTAREFKLLVRDDELVETFRSLSLRGVRIGVVSNSIRETLDVCLDKLGIAWWVDVSISNEDVSQPKPSPEGYKMAMRLLGAKAKSTFIFEDSAIGREAAVKSGAILVPVDSRKDLTEKIKETMNSNQPNVNFNILIPMAGAGSRFIDAGYTIPKPLVEVNGVAIIQHAIDSLDMNGNHIYLVPDQQIEDYSLNEYLRKITADHNAVTVLSVKDVTEGAAVTALLAKEIIDNDTPLVICNSDQLVEWVAADFLQYAGDNNLDGCIAVFENDDPKWSYVELNEYGFVGRVAEKEVISNLATVGIYYWKHGSDFVKYAEEMIAGDYRTNGEFYIAPAYNEAIIDNKTIGIYKVDKMIGLGTPEDVEAYAKDSAQG